MMNPKGGLNVICHKEEEIGKTNHEGGERISRRRFLWQAGMATAGLMLSGCGRILAPATATPTIAAPARNGLAKVGTARVDRYDKALVRDALGTIFDSVGGLGDVIGLGDKVAIKTNVTGGSMQRLGNLPGIETIFTHPVVVEVVAELIIDAGAGEVYIVEAIYDEGSWDLGFRDIAERLGATLVDLNRPEPYDSLSTDPVGEGWYIYESFYCNRVLNEVDALVSVSKMKGHGEAGVTHTIKNMVGSVPWPFYELKRPELRGYRSEFHGTGDETKARLPRVIIDLNRAHPVAIGVVDGIKTMEGGEGPWIEGVRAIQPGVLIAGKSPLAVDAVATGIMGFDPTAEYPDPPFLHCDNHLNLAREMGFGTNRLEEIEVVGPSIDELVTPFKTVQAPRPGAVASAMCPRARAMRRAMRAA
jgi:uncharacterized protein (DUF362 family)